MTKTSPYAFFGLQLAIPQPASVWDEHPSFNVAPLREHLSKGARAQRLFEKRRFWNYLAKHTPAAVVEGARGYWDLIRDHAAEREYERWSAELERLRAARAEEQGAVVRHDDSTKPGTEPTFALFTAIFLVTAGSPTDDTLGMICDHPEDRWFTREVFRKLLRDLTLLDFGYVQTDAAYLVPGEKGLGFPAQVIEGEGYEYLRPLT